MTNIIHRWLMFLRFKCPCHKACHILQHKKLRNWTYFTPYITRAWWYNKKWVITRNHQNELTNKKEKILQASNFILWHWFNGNLYWSHKVKSTHLQKDDQRYDVNQVQEKEKGKLHWHPLLLGKLDSLDPSLGKWHSAPKFAK